MEEKKRKGPIPEIPFDLVQDDPMSRFFTKAWDFCYTHTKVVILGGVGFFALVFGISGYVSWGKTMAQEASARLGLALQVAAGEEGRIPPALLAEIQNIATSYPGTLSGRLAYIHEARMSFENGDAPAALKSYDAAFAVLGGDRFWGDLIAWERAHVYMALENQKAALEDFTRVVLDRSFLEESALFHMARLESDLGEMEKSREIFERMLESYPDSPYKEADFL